MSEKVVNEKNKKRIDARNAEQAECQNRTDHVCGNTNGGLTQCETTMRQNQSACICFYRFIQEGLNNAHHHAPGAACSIMANCIDDTIEVKVTDQGAGFDPAYIKNTNAGSGLGLAGLRERIESLGGQFEIQSTIDKGTVLLARFSIADLEIVDGE